MGHSQKYRAQIKDIWIYHGSVFTNFQDDKQKMILLDLAIFFKHFIYWTHDLSVNIKMGSKIWKIKGYITSQLTRFADSLKLIAKMCWRKLPIMLPTLLFIANEGYSDSKVIYHIPTLKKNNSLKVQHCKIAKQNSCVQKKYTIFVFLISAKSVNRCKTDLGSWWCSDVPFTVNCLHIRSFSFLHNLHRFHNSFRSSHLKLTNWITKYHKNETWTASKKYFLQQKAKASKFYEISSIPTWQWFQNSQVLKVRILKI